MQRVLRLIFPPHCISCGEPAEAEFALCGPCWRATPFIGGAACDICGAPLQGDMVETRDRCDDCIVIARPWQQGRAALRYGGNGKRIVLALKHGDRLELVKPAVRWMVAAGQSILHPDMLVVPVPAHWLRLFRRRYNQAAVLATGVARSSGLECLPDALIRSRHTAVQDGIGRDQRFRNLVGAISPHPRNGAALSGRDVLLIDDVMTSGATLAASSEACLAAGATRVFVLVLARVAKDT